MADEAPAEVPAEAPAEGPAAEAPAAEVPAAEVPAAEAPPAEAPPAAEPPAEAPAPEAAPEPAAPPAEPAKDEGAPQPAESPKADEEAAAPPAEAEGVVAPPPEGPGEPLAKSSAHEMPAGEEGARASALRKGDSLIRTSSVSFNKPTDIQRTSLMEPRKSSLYARGSRPSKDGYRRSTRKSYASMVSIKRGSFASFQERAKTPKYMNSYKLESDKPFNVDKVYGILVEILTENIDDQMMYDHESCPTKAKLVSGLIRTRVKEQDFDRYKLVCLVTIGEKKSYDILTAVRFLWDEERDKYATYMHENMYVYAVASVFAMYYE